jgi:hypothetical protein
MNTDDLIASISAELTPCRPGLMTAWVIRGVILGLVITAVSFAAFWGVRPNVIVIVIDPALFAKSALPLLLGALALPSMLAQARPAGKSWSTAACAVVAILLGLIILATLYLTPYQQWWADMVGNSITICLMSIPVLSVPILAGALIALRRGAPEHPSRCGAVAGLVAAGFGAAIYSLFCIEDSPLFYGVWYTLSIFIVTLIGAVAGRSLLRW